MIEPNENTDVYEKNLFPYYFTMIVLFFLCLVSMFYSIRITFFEYNPNDKRIYISFIFVILCPIAIAYIYIVSKSFGIDRLELNPEFFSWCDMGTKNTVTWVSVKEVFYDSNQSRYYFELLKGYGMLSRIQLNIKMYQIDQEYFEQYTLKSCQKNNIKFIAD